MAAISWLWLAAGLGFSPVLLELVAHMAREPWARYASIFVPLAGILLASARRGPPRYDGLLLVVLAIGWELVAIDLRSAPLARPALVLAAIGLCRLGGVACWPRLLLVAWVVPVPTMLQQRLSPAAEQLWTEWAAALAPFAPQVEGHVLVAASGSLSIGAAQGGLPLAALLSGCVWASVAARDGSLARCLLAALAAALLAVPIQIAALWIAMAGLALGSLEFARWTLAPGAWMVVGGMTLAWLRSGGSRRWR